MILKSFEQPGLLDDHMVAFTARQRGALGAEAVRRILRIGPAVAGGYPDIVA